MGVISVVFAPLVLLLVGVRQSLPVTAPAEPGTQVKWWALLRKRSFLSLVGGTAFIAAAGYLADHVHPGFPDADPVHDAQ